MATATATDAVVFEEHGQITVLKLNRPERLNAFSGEMANIIGSYMRSLNQGDYDTRCVIITGEGRAFSAGADVADGLARRIPGNDPERPPWRPGHPEQYAGRAIRDCDIPVISAINGHCVGMGWGLALSTDLRIAAEDAKFQVAQLKRGIMADFGLGHFLPQQAGHQAALDLMLTGRMIDAQRALELGLVLKVVPNAQLMDAAFELAEEIVTGPSLSIAASKRVVYMNDNDDMQRVTDYTALALGHLMNSEDFREGVNSFLEKRPAQYRGR
jgi:enoyl-CoA hydratase/carnithine racemase